MISGTVLAIAYGMTTRVSDLMNRSVITIRRDESLRAAARAMSTHDVGGLPVFHEGRVVGIISKTDLVDRLADTRRERGTTVGDVMSEDLVWAAPDEAVETVARRMRFEGVHHVVVRDDAGELVGILSTWDMLHLIANAPSPPLNLADELPQE